MDHLDTLFEETVISILESATTFEDGELFHWDIETIVKEFNEAYIKTRKSQNLVLVYLIFEFNLSGQLTLKVQDLRRKDSVKMEIDGIRDNRLSDLPERYLERVLENDFLPLIKIIYKKSKLPQLRLKTSLTIENTDVDIDF